MASIEGARGRRARRLTLALALLAAGLARAQTTSTIIGVVTDASTGLPIQGARVAATGPGLPGEQSATAGEEGGYRLTFLPPGPYRIAASAQGFLPAGRDDILLRADKTLRVNLVLVPSTVRLPEQTVHTVAPAVDVAKAETAVVVPREAYDVLPLATRSFQAAVAVAPSATREGGLDGAQPGENGVLVEGLNVSDPGDNTLYLVMPQNFVEQLDLKTGNYLPEYGRVTGGILSVVTRSGSNEVHGSAFSSLLLKRSGMPIGTLGEAIWRRDLGGPHSYEADAGFELGGPIVRDRLWFHLGLDPAVRRTVIDRYLRANALDAGGTIVRDGFGLPVMFDLGSATRMRTEQVTYRFTGKLTWAPTEDHTFTLATFGSPYRTDGWVRLQGPSYQRPAQVEDPVVDGIVRWNGRFLGKRLLAEAAVGWHLDDYQRHPAWWSEGVDMFNTPMVRWGYWTGAMPLGTFEPVPAACDAGPDACRVTSYVTGGGEWFRSRVQRYQARASLSWLGQALGTHQVKGGADLEWTRGLFRDHGLFFDYMEDEAFTGFQIFAGGSVRAPGTSPADLTYAGWTENRARSFSPALFLQDSWQPVPSVTLNAGLRWEALDQDNALNQDPRARIRIRDSFAPRAQVVWDPSGQGRAKVAVAWGRYYETIPLSIGMVSFGSQNAFWTRYAAQSCPGFAGPGSAPFDPRTCTALVPNAATDLLGNQTTVGILPGTTPVAPDLKGQYLDQFGATLEYELFSDLTLAVEYQGRRQGRVVEDLSSNDGISYFIANPGEGKPFSYAYAGLSAPLPLDPRGAVLADQLTGRGYYAPFPKATRSYDGVTVRATKSWSRRWLAFASYTWSKLHGNYPGPNNEGLVNNGPQYDLPSLITNTDGLLPNDHTHVVKLYAARRFEVTSPVSVDLGAGYAGSSGTPVNATGSHYLYGRGYSYLIPRGMAGRTPFLSQLDLRLQVEVALARGKFLRLRLDVLNALDARTPTAVDERYTFSYAQPIVGAGCRSGNALSAQNPAAALQAACPDLVYLRALDGRPIAVNANYGQPTAFQAPRAFQVGMEVTF